MTFVKITKRGLVERWTIARPERSNALGTVIAAELTAALAALTQSLSAPQAPRVLVVGATPVVKGLRRTWIAGGDLKELTTLDTAASAHAYAASLAALINGLDELPIPVVMAVDGAAIGGGAEFAIGGDIRLATRSSSWAWKQLRVGLATGYASCARLVGLVGAARAQGLLFLGEVTSCDEALRLGLTHRLVDDAESLAHLIETVTEDLCTLAPEALSAQKAMLRRAADADRRTTTDAELALFAGIWRNPRHAEFLATFTGKEPS